MTVVIAFAGTRRLAFGALEEVASAVRASDAAGAAPLLIFDAASSHRIELDPRDIGEAVEAPAAAEPPAPDEPPGRGRGRPRLGVVSREITLLPRHWAWLEQQRGAPSAMLRRLVEAAMRTDAAAGALRRGQDALYRFATVMAGNAPGYEAAMRALYAGDEARFTAETDAWPTDVRAHALVLAKAAFDREASPPEPGTA